MKTLATLCIITITLLASCKQDDPVSPSSSSFAGNWSFIISGEATGSGTVSIGNDGAFSLLLTFVTPSGSTANVVSGKVLSNGNVSDGKIYYNGTQIGTIAGTFSGNTGSGSYSSNYNGTWAATKQ